VVTCKAKILTEEDFAFLNASGSGKKEWEIPSGVTLEEINNQAITATLQRTHGNIKERRRSSASTARRCTTG